MPTTISAAAISDSTATSARRARPDASLRVAATNATANPRYTADHARMRHRRRVVEQRDPCRTADNGPHDDADRSHELLERAIRPEQHGCTITNSIATSATPTRRRRCYDEA
jgi:hypothetical protein